MTEQPNINDNNALSADNDTAWKSFAEALSDTQVLRGLIEDLKVSLPLIKGYTELLKIKLTEETISTDETISFLNRIAAISTSATERVNEALDSRRKHWNSPSP